MYQLLSKDDKSRKWLGWDDIVSQYIWVYFISGISEDQINEAVKSLPEDLTPLVEQMKEKLGNTL